MAWGLGEILDAALKILTPVASSAASAYVGNTINQAMAPKAPGLPSPSTFMPSSPATPAQAASAGSTAAGAGQGSAPSPTSMNFQGGFTGAAPSNPSQGPKPISEGFSSMDPKKKQPIQGAGFEGI